MDKYKVIISNRQKEVKLPTGLRLLIRRCCNAVLAQEKFSGSAEISVTIVTNEEIRKLNKEYRDKDTATDVLSFPLGVDGVYEKNEETGAFMLGDIVISAQKAVEQAKNYGHTFNREMSYLTVHSMYHLLGYDHEQGGLAAVTMREKEEIVLEQLGLARQNSFTV